jgi:hypothetical protein
MVAADQQQTDDFFETLVKEREQTARPSLADEEIIFRDADGKLKVFGKGGTREIPEPAAETSPPVAAALTTSAPSLQSPIGDDDVAEELAAVMKQSKVTFSDETQEQQFKSVVRTRLKGARNHVQAQQLLINLGFAEAVVDQVLDRVSSLIDQRNDRLRKKFIRSDSFDHPAKVQQPATAESAQPEEVKFQPQLVGPVDELAVLTLTDFRRLAPSAEQAADAVLEKVRVLELDSFAQRLAGIRAWQGSAVNRLYVRIGQDSMASGQPVEQVIAARQAAKQPSLTEEEFSALTALNRKLRHHQ